MDVCRNVLVYKTYFRRWNAFVSDCRNSNNHLFNLVRFLIGIFVGIYIGIIMGWKFSGSAYRPMLMAQAHNIQYLEDEKIRFIKSFRYLEIEGEAHKQDMREFEKKSSLVAVLKRLGIYRHFKYNHSERYNPHCIFGTRGPC